YILARTSLPIPVDLFLGRGVYVFPNYKNWFVPFSRSITWVYDVAFQKYPETVRSKNRRYLQRNLKRWLSRTNKVLTISNVSAKEIGQYYPDSKKKVEVVYLGIDPETYYPRPQVEVQAIARKYKLPEEYFLFVGNIEPRKNIGTLLEAYKEYSDRVKDPTPLLLVSDGGWDSEPVLQRVVELQDQGYKIIGPLSGVPDESLPALYSGAKALLLMAIHEGFGLPPVEALACGTPVIVSDLEVFREVLPREHVTLVSPMDEVALSKALLAVSGKHFLGRSAFTWDLTVTSLLEASKEISKPGRM
ncbi:MAG TPA: glycosyltransferase family 1 protein, partial [Patescibacteria group bacterium]|nr:glycosyltransferase family 1 protein [Patescibacteria group bacterium]